MSRKITTSIRLDEHLRRALEQRARRENRGKNWIISRALEAYLDEDPSRSLAEAARRQSILASRTDTDDWTEAADFQAWK